MKPLALALLLLLATVPAFAGPPPIFSSGYTLEGYQLSAGEFHFESMCVPHVTVASGNRSVGALLSHVSETFVGFTLVNMSDQPQGGIVVLFFLECDPAR